MPNTTSAKEMLGQVNSAITAILAGGQSYRIGSRSLTRADLAMLKSFREELEAQVAEGDLSDGTVGLFSRTFVAEFDGR